MPRDFSVLKSREIAWCNSARQASHSASQVRGAAADERPHGCASGGYAFLHVLSDGHTVATAVEIATQVTPKFDVVSSLRLLFCLSASRARNVHNRQRCHKCHKAPREVGAPSSQGRKPAGHFAQVAVPVHVHLGPSWTQSQFTRPILFNPRIIQRLMTFSMDCAHASPRSLAEAVAVVACPS